MSGRPMARRTATDGSPAPETGGGPDPPHGRFPGLSESLPLLMFGAAAVVAGVYLVATRAPGLGGHIPLWAYLTTLGSIAIAGGLAGSVVGDPMDDLPKAGDAVGEDLLVVPRSEWLELRSQALGARAEVAGARLRSSEPAPSPVRTPLREPARIPSLPNPAAANPSPAVPPSGGVPDWWETALAARTPSEEGDPVFPTGVPAPKPEDEVLSSLDAIAVEATPKVLVPEPPIRAAPQPPPGALLQPPRPRAPRARPAPSPIEIDLQLDEIARGVDHLLPPAGAVSPPGTPPAVPPVACVRCQNPVAAGSADLECESCGRPLCGNCLDLAKGEGNPGLCQVCAMLLDSAGGT